MQNSLEILNAQMKFYNIDQFFKRYESGLAVVQHPQKILSPFNNKSGLNPIR